MLRSKEYIASKKAKKREDNAKRYDDFKRALAKKEKWEISRAKIKTKSFQKLLPKKFSKIMKTRRRLRSLKRPKKLGKNLKT